MPKNLLLLGAGHAHAEVLRRFARQPLKDVEITLVSPQAFAPYTGMAPGIVSGRYALKDATIDAGALSEKAGAKVAYAKAEAIDPTARTVRLDDGSSLPYDLLSINVGGAVIPPFEQVKGGPAVLSVKPVEPFLEALDASLARARNPKIIVAGGGYGGVELAAALKARGAGVALATGPDGLAPDAPAKARIKIKRLLQKRLVHILDGRSVCGAATDKDGGPVALLDDGDAIPCSHIVLATGVSPPSLLKSVPHLTDETGFLRVNAFLQCANDPSIFAAGDCAALRHIDTGAPAQKAGVYAVREGPVLAENLRAALTGERLRYYEPQGHALAILSFHPDGAVLVRGRRARAGRIVGMAKSLIDRRFINRYRVAP
ncbi:MAG: FAD-dependent oxidoreductase [Pseudomonadota bacterium]